MVSRVVLRIVFLSPKLIDRSVQYRHFVFSFYSVVMLVAK